MLRRVITALDATDVVIGAALIALFVGVTLKIDFATALIADALAALVLIVVAWLAAR